MKRVEKVGVIGLGYVGLTLSLALVEKGFNVIGSETYEKTREEIIKGVPPFFESGLEKFLKDALKSGNFEITDSLDDSCDSYIMCVGSPIDSDKNPVMTSVDRASRELANCLKKDSLVVIRSTLPIGTTRNRIIPILEESGKKCGKDFSLVYAPERTLEGKAVEEIYSNPQIIGAYDEESAEKASSLFRRVTPVIVNVSSIEAAEAIKLLDNTSRDANFAFANLFAELCENKGLDAYEIIKAANIHYPRNRIPLPSPGVGGPCLKKDTHLLISSCQGMDNLELIASLRNLNEEVPKRMVRRINEKLTSLGKNIGESNFFLVGFAFKGYPETDDLRDSTSLWFLDELKKFTKNIKGYDPVINSQSMGNFRRQKGDTWAVSRQTLESQGIQLVDNYEQGFRDADCAVFLNNHKSYSDIDIISLSKLMRKPAIIFDSWRLLDPNVRDLENMIYMGVGL